MPYFVTDNHPDCPGVGVVKEDGELLTCYEGPTATEDAIDNMVAMSLAEDLEPGGEFEGEFRAAPDALSVGDFVSWDNPGGRSQGRITEIERDGQINVPDSSFTINGEESDPAALIQVFQEDDEDGWQPTDVFVGHRFSTLTKIADLRQVHMDATLTSSDATVPGTFLRQDQFETAAEANARAEEIGCSGSHEMTQDGETIYMPCSTHNDYEEVTGGSGYRSELRQVDLTPPAYMRAAARRGVELFEEGLAGDGVTDQTVAEARAMARGNVTADKWTRIAPWIARHLTDLDAEQNQPGEEGFPGAGAVAFYLWGATPTDRGAERVRAYAEGVTERLEAENEGRAKGEAMGKLETRTQSTQFEIREVDGGGMLFEGYAALFDSPSEPLPFTEKIERGAFRGSLKQRNDIKILWNHDTGSVLGSTRAGTLNLIEDTRGLKVSAQLPNTTAGRDAAELLRRGDVDAMSFGFSVPKNGDSWNAEGTERTLRQVRLHEVSIVAFPAYAGTSGLAQVRGLDKVAQRMGLDNADVLADALLKIESGDKITLEEKSMIGKVLDNLAPETTNEKEFDGEAWLQLKKQKLKLLKAEK